MKHKNTGIIKRTAISVMAAVCALTSATALSANAVVEPVRSASTGNQKANGLTVSGTVIQYDTYMLGTTTCSNVNAKKKVKNTYYYYNSNGNFTSKTVADPAYVINGFTGYTERTNFNKTASGDVRGVKCKHYVQYSGSVIWTETTSAGKIKA